MAVDFESTLLQSKEKWMAKWVNRPVKKEYFESGKVSIIAKCPKCDILHETFVKWTGRGMPRIYCVNCRSLVAAISDANGICHTPDYAKSARKGIPHNID